MSLVGMLALECDGDKPSSVSKLGGWVGGGGSSGTSSDLNLKTKAYRSGALVSVF